MKVLCEREQLREGLAVTTSVIPGKSTRTAVENVCIVATDDALELVGTDLDVAIRYRVDQVKVEDPGTALVPARVTADFVRDLTADTVTLQTDDTHFRVESGSDHCELTTIDPDEYPVVARFSEEGSMRVAAGAFTRLIAKTGFAAAREQGRYAMHGILTLVEDDELKMIATDGRRLALASCSLEGSEAASKSAGTQVIVPSKGMQLFSRVVDDPHESVLIHFGENQLGMKTSRAEVFARLIDGEFPRYSAVIPESTENFLEVDADLFLQKLRLVSNVTSDETRAVRLSLDKGNMKVFGRSASTGEASTELEVEFEGKPGHISFNPDFVMDGLKNCETQTVRLEYNQNASPGKFTLGENYVYIVMPITNDS